MIVQACDDFYKGLWLNSISSDRVIKQPGVMDDSKFVQFYAWQHENLVRMIWHPWNQLDKTTTKVPKL